MIEGIDDRGLGGRTSVRIRASPLEENGGSVSFAEHALDSHFRHFQSARSVTGILGNPGTRGFDHDWNSGRLTPKPG